MLHAFGEVVGLLERICDNTAVVLKTKKASFKHLTPQQVDVDPVARQDQIKISDKSSSMEHRSRRNGRIGR